MWKWIILVLLARSVVSASFCGNLSSIEYFALEKVFSEWNGPHWRWWPKLPGVPWSFNTIYYNAPCDNWQGIKCNCAYFFDKGTWNFTISEIYLHDHNISGVVPYALTNLTNLNNLRVDGNLVSGTFPRFISQMISLNYLNFSRNMMEGPIPAEVSQLRNLSQLGIAFNFFNGTLPESIGNNTLLQFLDMSGNYFVGSIPISYQPLTALRSFQASGNSLTGKIPSWIGDHWPYLSILSLSQNYLVDKIPDSLCLLSNLSQISLNSNSLTGEIPTCIGNLSHLFWIQLGFNYFTGPLPNSMSLLSRLTIISLASNSFFGSLPSWIGTLGHLKLFNVMKNKFYGTIPTSFSSLINIGGLILSQNSFSGSLPIDFVASSKLVLLWLDDNFFSGSFPFPSFSLPLLSSILLEHNSFSGNIASNTFVGYEKLSILDISNNLFSGEFPSSIFLLPNVSSISSVSNCFSGELSNQICNLPSSIVTLALDGLSSNVKCPLTVKRNSLRPSFVHGFLQGQSMKGTIPDCLFRLPNIQLLHLSGNGFTGPIPDIVANSTLLDVSLCNNQLTGFIPSSIQSHTFLELDLSSNKISGVLDESFFSISSENSFLRLQVNRLSGRIPNSIYFGNFSTLDILSGNLFQCGNIPGKDIDHTSYSCGSRSLNDAAYAWTVIFGTFALCGLIYAFIEELERLLENILSCLKRFGQLFMVTGDWWLIHLAITDKQFSFPMPHTILLIKGLRFGMYLSIFLLSIIIIFLVPIYLSLKSAPGQEYSTVTDQYAWILSSAFLHGYPPVILVGSVVIGLVVIVFLSSWKHYNISKSFLSILKGISFAELQRSTSRIDLKIKFSLKSFLWNSVLQIVNLVVTVAVNAAYVNAALQSHKISSSQLFAIQTAMGIFKFMWNVTYIPYATDAMALSARSRLNNRLLMSQINYIVAPCIATIALNPACFFYIFTTQDPIVSSYSTKLCDTIDFQTNSCIHYRVFDLSTQFTPPFFYSYQCASALVNSFSPVLLYSYVLSGVILPMSYYVMSLVQHFSLRFHTTTKLLISHSDEQSSTVFGARLFNAISSQFLALSGFGMMVMVFQDITVLLTFGVSCPVLAVAVVCAIVSETVIWRLLIGKEIYFAMTYRPEGSKANSSNKEHTIEDSNVSKNPLAISSGIDSLEGTTSDDNQIVDKESNSSTSPIDDITTWLNGRSLPKITNLLESFDIMTLPDIEKDCTDTWKVFHASVWFVITAVSTFWGLFFFDMVADLYGDFAGLGISVGFILGLPIIIISTKLGIHFFGSGYMNLSKKDFSQFGMDIDSSEFAERFSQSGAVSGALPRYSISMMNGLELPRLSVGRLSRKSTSPS